MEIILMLKYKNIRDKYDIPINSYVFFSFLFTVLLFLTSKKSIFNIPLWRQIKKVATQVLIACLIGKVFMKYYKGIWLGSIDFSMTLDRKKSGYS